MKISDPLYFPRTELATTLLQNLRMGISNAFTLFAPRRMGKTQFLLNDITPVAQKMGFNVFYFSFMTEKVSEIETELKNSLLRFLQEISLSKKLSQIKSIDILGISVEKETLSYDLSMTEIINQLAKDNKPTLLLFDEVQELARIKGTEGLVRALRTGLDINKDKIKVIFTGSSTNGLRLFFNDSKAPFFHFSHSINFPNLDQQFSDYLADIYYQRTENSIDKTKFYAIFEQLQFTPLYLRSITQDMIIDPSLSLENATRIRLAQMYEHTDYSQQWQKLDKLEKYLLIAILQQKEGIYTEKTRTYLAQKLGVEKVTTSTIQTKLKKLARHELISKQSNEKWQINNNLFKHFLEQLLTE